MPLSAPLPAALGALDETNNAYFIVRDGNGQALALRLFRGGFARRRISSPATRPGASPPTSPSCRNSSAMGNEGCCGAERLY
jgi:hypothetical protein